MSTATGRKGLDKIADDLHDYVTRTGRTARFPLPRGLQLALRQRPGGLRRLALGRRDVCPSDTEIAICRKAFCVPDDAQVTTSLVDVTGEPMYIVDIAFDYSMEVKQ